MRTLEDIIPPSRRREEGTPNPSYGETNTTSSRGMRPRRRLPLIIIIVALIVIGLSIFVIEHFSRASIEIVPETASISINGTYAAGGQTSSLPFQVITTKKTGTADIPATGTKQVSTNASGKITIYNTQPTAQKLIANTRFANSAGLIYRIHSAVTIPKGTANAPGEITATVYADQPGSTYNIAPSSFTVPGLAGTPQENSVYARSTSSMTGGATGAVPVVDASAEATAVSSIEGTLTGELADGIKSDIPSGYILVPGGSTTTFVELTPTASQTAGQATISVEGAITAVIFPTTALASTLISTSSAADFSRAGAMLASSSALTLSDISNMPATNADSFTFSIAGTANLTAVVNPSQIATAVAGKTRSEAQTALSSYPEVKQAILVLRPFWKSTFPQDPAAISVKVVPATP